MTRRHGIQRIAPILAIVLSACGAAAQGAAPPARPSASHLAMITANPPVVKPRPPVVVDAAYVADELGSVEQAIRNPETPVGEYASLGQRQQIGYHRLAAHPDLGPAVLNSVAASGRSAIHDNLSAP